MGKNPDGFSTLLWCVSQNQLWYIISVNLTKISCSSNRPVQTASKGSEPSRFIFSENGQTKRTRRASLINSPHLPTARWIEPKRDWIIEWLRLPRFHLRSRGLLKSTKTYNSRTIRYSFCLGLMLRGGKGHYPLSKRIMDSLLRLSFVLLWGFFW